MRKRMTRGFPTRRRVVALLALLGVGCSESAAPSRPAAIVYVGTPGISATVGQAVSPAPQIEIRDAEGGALSGISFTVAVTAGGGTIAGAPLKTTSGSTSLGTWTLGSSAGAQALTITSGSLSALVINATGVAGPPANIAASSATTGTGTTSGLAPFEPSVRVTDAFGNGVPSFVLSTSVSGGGSIEFAAPATNAFGFATVGDWTLGPSVGDNVVTMTAGSLPSRTFTVTATGPAPASIAVGAGSFQTAAPNTALATNPMFRVRDAGGSPIPGATVQFQVLSGGGNVTTTSAVADAQGDASPGTWTLGATPGAQRLRASIGGLTQTLYATALAPAGGTYDVVVRYIGTPPSAAVQTAFANVVNRVQSQIVADLPSHSVNVNIAGCITGGPVVSEVIDDLVVYVRIAPIDGVGETLGRAGPCWPLPGDTRLPSIGVMELDEADVADLLSLGQLEMTILHEMHHILGLGTWWPSFFQGELIQGSSTSNPVYLGAAGNASYVANGGVSAVGLRIENNGVPGSTDGHWRESLFGNELMTSGLNGGLNPLSAFSIMSLADFGYSVSTAGADAYTVPAGALRTAGDLAPVQRREMLLRPTYGGVDAYGRPMPVAPPLRSNR